MAMAWGSRQVTGSSAAPHGPNSPPCSPACLSPCACALGSPSLAGTRTSVCALQPSVPSIPDPHLASSGWGAELWEHCTWLCHGPPHNVPSSSLRLPHRLGPVSHCTTIMGPGALWVFSKCLPSKAKQVRKTGKCCTEAGVSIVLGHHPSSHQTPTGGSNTNNVYTDICSNFCTSFKNHIGCTWDTQLSSMQYKLGNLGLRHWPKP